jgi:hypothetical protein
MARPVAEFTGAVFCRFFPPVFGRIETGRLYRPVVYVSQRARRPMPVSAPTPIPDIRLAAPNCCNRQGTAAAIQAACTSRYRPDRQAGGPR